MRQNRWHNDFPLMLHFFCTVVHIFYSINFIYDTQSTISFSCIYTYHVMSIQTQQNAIADDMQQQIYIFCFFSTFLMTKCVIKTLANGKFDSVYIFNIKKNWIYIGRHGISHKCSKSILLNEQIWKLTKNWYYKEKFSI